ncbi:MAG: flagellar motor protein MotB [Nitrospira sp.]|nr:flagellar motor protein MotB [Nitrospira sp.]
MRPNQKEIIMRGLKTTVVMTGVVVLMGCASSLKQPDPYIKQSQVCTDRWYGYYQESGCPSVVKAAAPDPSKEMAARQAALEGDRQRLSDDLDAARQQNGALSSRANDLERQLADRDGEIAVLRTGADEHAVVASQLSAELAAARQRNSDLESQLADRDKELEELRGALSAEMEKLKEAQRGVLRALRPEFEKGDITIDLNNERLLINLSSAYLFASGQDELKPAGVNALKQVGAVLKDYPEYKVAVDGHTDSVPIQGALKKKFPTNKELSESRAVNAAKALQEGGLSAPTTHGYADTKPVESNTTAAGRAKNRRVEVRVTR